MITCKVLYFALKSKCRDKFDKFYLSDINLDLVTSYNAVKNYPYKVIGRYQELFKNHSKEFYLRLREKPVSSDPVHIGARFLYLNRYSFKGIYRLNVRGEFAGSFSTREYNNDNFRNKIIW